MSKLAGRRALVTGASRGIGAAIAKAMAAAGAHVVLAARGEPPLHELKREIERLGGSAEVRPADLSTREACRNLAHQCGSIDVLVNNARAMSAREDKPVLERDDAMWDGSLQLNLLAPLTLMQELGAGMRERGRGVIINITSIAAHQARPLRGAYTATKAALESLTRVAAMELGPHGVRVLAVAPGMTQTPSLAAALPTGMTGDALARRYVPIGRMVRAEEIASVCCYLASDEAEALTGTVITVDGGLTAGRYSFSLTEGSH